MLVETGAPKSTLRPIARALKQGFDDLQEMDSGWRWIEFDHPAFGRDAAHTTADRLPGEILIGDTEPGEEADALVVLVGYVDSFTGDVHLGDGMVVSDEGRDKPKNDGGDRSRGEFPNRWLAAVALWEEGDVKALTGSVHETRENTFEAVSLGANVDEAIREWIEEIASAGAKRRRSKR